MKVSISLKSEFDAENRFSVILGKVSISLKSELNSQRSHVPKWDSPAGVVDQGNRTSGTEWPRARKSITITVLLYYYCSTVLVYYCSIVLLFYCLTVLLDYCVFLYYCITEYHCIVVVLY